MDTRVRYRTAKQEAWRKNLIAKIWAAARERGWDREELYEAVGALAKAKLVYLYKYNWVATGNRQQAIGNRQEKRVSLSTLKGWQLEQIIEGLCGERVIGRAGERVIGRSGDREIGGLVAKVLGREEWAKGDIMMTGRSGETEKRR